jgi:hypothetical protein
MMVFNELYDDMQKDNHELKIDKDSDDFIYQVCNKYLGTNEDGNYADNVKKIWEKIQTTYTTIYNWYKNPDIYHLIGLLVWLKEYKVRGVDKDKRFSLIKEMMKEYNSKSKDNFIMYLKKQIAEIIHVEESKETKEGVIPWGLKFINYHDNALQIIRILVTLNVEDIRMVKDESARFPFHLLREHNITSLEHIHPQNLILDNIKLDTLEEWLRVKEDCLDQLNKLDQYKEKINKLKELIKDETTYKENKDYAQTLINEIDEEFDELASMSDEQMHTLYNLALVDKETNSALNNNLLDRKREILRDYQEQKKTYVLPSTQKVFSKYYSPANESNVLPKLWTKQDRDAYFLAIEKVYNQFIYYYSKK